LADSSLESSLALADIFAGKSVLVTGGCGFIGSHLVDWLVTVAGANVTVLDNLQAGQWSKLDGLDTTRLRCEEGDVRDAARVRGLISEINAAFVFHLAANASVPLSVTEPAYDYETNASGTFVVLDALRELQGADCARVVVASSGAVYGEPASFPIREVDPLIPISPYGASKLTAEVQGRIFQRVYKQPIVLARIFNCYGPRMARFVILDFLRKLSLNPNRLEVLGNGKQVRDFTYVSDTVSGLLHLAAYGVPGEAYNISSGVNYSVTTLAEKMIEARGLTGTTEIAYTGSSWAGDAQRWEVDIDKIRGIGYEPQFTLSDGLLKTIAWFDDNNIA